jgi:hypothetical protein
LTNKENKKRLPLERKFKREFFLKLNISKDTKYEQCGCDNPHNHGRPTLGATPTRSYVAEAGVDSYGKKRGQRAKQRGVGGKSTFKIQFQKAQTHATHTATRTLKPCNSVENTRQSKPKRLPNYGINQPSDKEG